MTFSISGSVSTLLGDDYTAGEPVALWVEPSQPIIMDGATGRVGGRIRVPVAADGTFQLDELPATASGTSPLYRLIVDAITLRRAGKFQGETTGWFPLEANRDLTWIVTNYVPLVGITAQTQANIAAAVALGATNNTATASFIGTAGATQTALDARIASQVPSATTTTQGRVELATSTEARTGTDTTRAVTPAAAAAAFAAILPAPSGADDSAALNSALSSGALVLDGRSRTYSIASSITVPAGVTLTNLRLNLTTAGMNGVLVSSRSKVLGAHIYGTGTTNIIERGIYPATDGASDVDLDVTVENMTVGVHAMPLASTTPKRWMGKVRARNIVGLNNGSEGYGLLLSPASNCQFDFNSTNVKRHSVYLSAGASNNTIRAVTSGNDHGPLQIASYNNQPACQFNTIDLTCDAVANTTFAGSTFGANLAGKVANNKVRVTISGSTTADGAVLLRTLDAGAVCRDNDVIVHAYGTFAGDVIRSDTALENVVEVYGSCATSDVTNAAIIGVYQYNGIVHTVTDYKYAMRVRAANVNALGTATRFVSSSQNAGLLDLGGRVNFQSSSANPIVSNFTSKVGGYAFEETMEVATASIAAGATGTAVFTFARAYLSQQVISLSAAQSGVTGVADAPTLAVLSTTTTGATISVKNNRGSAGAVLVKLRVAGY